MLKKVCSVLIVVSVLLTMCSCGKAGTIDTSNRITTSQNESVTEDTQLDDYIIPTSWSENSANDGSYGFITESSGFDGMRYTLFPGYVVSCTQSDGRISVTQYAYNGTEIKTVNLPVEDPSSNFTLLFTENSVWLLELVYTVSGDNDEYQDISCTLCQYDYDGTLLSEVDNSIFAGSPVYQIDEASNGELMLTGDDCIFFLSSEGEYLSTLDFNGMQLEVCKDSSDRTYLLDISGNTLYTIDWENHVLGQEVYSLLANGTLYPGSKNFDFYLNTNDTLYGISLREGMTTELLNWLDCGISSAGTTCFVEEDVLYVGCYDAIMDTNQILKMTRVPVDDVPAKTTVTLAVGLDETYQEFMTETDVISQYLESAISNFNLTSAEYQIDLTSFTSQQDLQLQILSGDAPDLILWNGCTEETISQQVFASKGYLVDLEALMKTDSDVSVENFIPSVISMEERYNGGLYTMPTSFYYVTYAGMSDYVGSDTGWDMDKFTAALKNMPEDMQVIDMFTQTDALDIFLDGVLSSFADLSTGTCDFQCDGFYEFLSACRDYFPSEMPADASYSEMSGTLDSLRAGDELLVAINGFGGPANMLAAIDAQEDGLTLVGYPSSTDGSGFRLQLENEMSICAFGKDQDAAWEFLKYVLGYDYQCTIGNYTTPVLQNAFSDLLDTIKNSDGNVYSDNVYSQLINMVETANVQRIYDSPVKTIIQEEAAAFFNGDKTVEETAELIQNRVKIYLSEQS